MKNSSRILYLFLLAILMTACGGRSVAEPTTDINAVMTSGVGTMVASFFETQTALYTPPVDTSTPAPSPTNTATIPPSLVPTLVASPTTQVIYFTHHRHLVELAGSNLGSAELSTHDLKSNRG